jgi:ATP-dependent Clp protease ATP-binding subunit ClpC
VIKRQSGFGFQHKVDEAVEEKLAYEEMRKKLIEALKRVFRPEFINRLDSVVVFRALNRIDIQQIVSLELAKVAERLKDNNISLTATPAAVDQLAEEGYDPDMGARPLRRVIQQKIEDRLSDALLAGEFSEGETVEVVVNEDKEIALRKVQATGEPEMAPEAAA